MASVGIIPSANRVEIECRKQGFKGGLPRGFRGPGHVTPLHAPIAARDVARASRKAGEMDEKEMKSR
jgi:hypothetical protein